MYGELLIHFTVNLIQPRFLLLRMDIPTGLGGFKPNAEVSTFNLPVTLASQIFSLSFFILCFSTLQGLSPVGGHGISCACRRCGSATSVQQR